MGEVCVVRAAELGINQKSAYALFFYAEEFRQGYSQFF